MEEAHLATSQILHRNAENVQGAQYHATVKQKITSTLEHFCKKSTTNRRNNHHQITISE